MKHRLKISVSKKPRENGVVAFKNVKIRERILRFLFGVPHKLTILVPGDSVEELSIQEIKEGATV